MCLDENHIARCPKKKALYKYIQALLRIQFDLGKDAKVKTKKCYLHSVIRALAHNASRPDKAVPALYYSSAAQSAIRLGKTSL